MQATAMNRERQQGHATAMAARIHAAASEALAARVSVRLLEQQVLAARMRADRLALRLARIEGCARRALAHTTDERVRVVLGDIVVTAAERDAPSAVA